MKYLYSALKNLYSSNIKLNIAILIFSNTSSVFFFYLDLRLLTEIPFRGFKWKALQKGKVATYWDVRNEQTSNIISNEMPFSFMKTYFLVFSSGYVVPVKVVDVADVAKKWTFILRAQGQSRLVTDAL